MKIDADEKELLESVERREWKSPVVASANRQSFNPYGEHFECVDDDAAPRGEGL